MGKSRRTAATRTLSGAVLGAVLVNLGKTLFTGLLPELWLYALGALFILTTLFLPRGIMGLRWGHLPGLLRGQSRRAKADAAP